jgi:drug/metabolite transporter (DMT)-like permease
VLSRRAHQLVPQTIGVYFVLTALTPVVVLPISYFLFKEKVCWQVLLGTVLAISGVAVLFLA